MRNPNEHSSINLRYAVKKMQWRKTAQEQADEHIQWRKSQILKCQLQEQQLQHDLDVIDRCKPTTPTGFMIQLRARKAKLSELEVVRKQIEASQVHIRDFTDDSTRDKDGEALAIKTRLRQQAAGRMPASRVAALRRQKNAAMQELSTVDTLLEQDLVEDSPNAIGEFESEDIEHEAARLFADYQAGQLSSISSRIPSYLPTPVVRPDDDHYSGRPAKTEGWIESPPTQKPSAAAISPSPPLASSSSSSYGVFSDDTLKRLAALGINT